MWSGSLEVTLYRGVSSQRGSASQIGEEGIFGRHYKATRVRGTATVESQWGQNLHFRAAAAAGWESHLLTKQGRPFRSGARYDQDCLVLDLNYMYRIAGGTHGINKLE